MQMKEKNAIYFWKIIFTYAICILHFNNIIEIRPLMGWYIAVEFFFMVSGYLLFSSVEQGRHQSAFGYTMKRIKKIYPYYLGAFVCTFWGYCCFNNLHGKEIVSKLLDSIWEIFLLQGCGLGRGWDYINCTLWYISVLLIVGMASTICF